MKRLMLFLGGNLRQFSMLFALVALIVFFQIRTNGLVLTSANMMNLLNGNAYILVLSIGMVLVIIAGHIDLSVGSVAAFAGIVTALVIRDGGMAPWMGIIICLTVGTLIGAWQGFWIAYVGVPAFIVTLAGMMLFRGANQFIGKSNTIPVPEEIQFLGGGYLPAIGPETGFNNLTLLLGAGAVLWLIFRSLYARRATRRVGGQLPSLYATSVRLMILSGTILYLTYLFASGRPGTSFPLPGLILVSLLIFYTFISSRTIIGRHIYAVGGNRQAAQLSGVNTRRVNFLVMMNMSILAALAGLMFIGRATASGPFDGVNWELDAIAAVFIGGAAVSGGVGTVIGSVIGGLVMAVLNNGLQLMGVGADMTQVIKGLVLLIAVAFDVYNKSQGRPAIISFLFGKKSPVAVGNDLSPSPKRSPSKRMFVVAVPLLVLIAVFMLLFVLWDRPQKGGGNLGVSGTITGFEKGAFIGVALPQKTSENWVLAEKLFREKLAEGRYQSYVQFANNGVPEQQNQIQTMVARGAKVIVVGAIDGSQLGAQVREAKNAGAIVIAYDRLLKNTDAVDYYVAYDNFKVGELQGKALLGGLKKRKGSGPWNIELIAGSPDDANSQVFFDGAMSILRPRIDDGTLVVQSKQITFAQVSTPGWKAENAQKRMDTILAGVYRREGLDGILSPNDTLARASLTSCRAAGKDLPVVTGQDSEVESVKSILKGEQYSTINKDTTALVQQAVTMVDDLRQGRAPKVNDTKSYHNGVKVVPACLLEPQIVTLENIQNAYANDPVLKDIVKQKMKK
jgi:putative multiple sugar transport system permease protein